MVVLFCSNLWLFFSQESIETNVEIFYLKFTKFWSAFYDRLTFELSKKYIFYNLCIATSPKSFSIGVEQQFPIFGPLKYKGIFEKIFANNYLAFDNIRWSSIQGLGMITLWPRQG